MVYIGSDATLPITAPWREESPRFYVEIPDDGDAEKIRGLLRKRHVIHAGSHEGCGCGFECGQGKVSGRNADEERLALESLRALHAYLVEATKLAPVDVYVCWANEEGQPATAESTAAPTHFAGESFLFFDPPKLTGRLLLHVVA